MTEIQNRLGKFGFSICFGFRYSCFGFYTMIYFIGIVFVSAIYFKLLFFEIVPWHDRSCGQTVRWQLPQNPFLRPFCARFQTLPGG